MGTTSDVRRALVATFIARTAANAALRVVYPFLPAIARGLDVTPATIATLIALRNLGGLATPLTARSVERRGRKLIMTAAIAAVLAGCVMTALTSTIVVAGIGIVIVGFAKPSFDMSMQSWFGERVPYVERGRIFGITELTWSVALLVAVPLSGFLIEATNWRAPFVLSASMALAGLVAILRGIDSDRPHEHARRALALNPERARVLAATLLFSVAAEIPFVVYGQWLEGSFGLTVAGIGTFTLVVVVAEFAGEGLVAVFADRWGLRRMLLGGLAVSGVAYLAFSITGASLVLATAVVVTWIASFEVTIVAAIPFASELAVDARERLLSIFAVMVGGGRVVGALVAQPLFSQGGIELAGVASACCVAAAALLLLGVPEHGLVIGSDA